jgi:aminomethyltransferase
MGQRFIAGPDHATTAAALAALTPGDFAGLGLGRMRYTLLLNYEGGIVDDLMVTRSPSAEDDGGLMLVFNAARKEIDDAYFRERLPAGIELLADDGRALLALQGPEAAKVMARHCPKAGVLSFMSATSAEFDGMDCHVSRSGYTGEDGFEISVAAAHAEAVVRALLGEPEVKPIGLGARDSLRLEAGLPLYGHDLDETTSPVEAGLTFAIAKSRRATGGFPGEERILRELAEGPSRRRVGIRPEGQAPAREGTEIENIAGGPIGTVTSGGFGPSVGGPIAMGYVDAAQAAVGAPLRLSVRGRLLPATVVAMPFVPHRYHRAHP